MNCIVALNNSSGEPPVFWSMVLFRNTTVSAPSPISPRGKNIIQGGPAAIDATILEIGSGYIIDADPLFVNAADPNGADDIWGTADDGLRLQTNSPAIGEGNADFLPQDIADVDGDGITDEVLPLDIAGFLRIQDGSLDLGAYEFGNSIQQLFTLIVQTGDHGSVSPSGSMNYTNGAIEILIATPDPGYVFDVWIGDASGSSNPLALTIDSNLSVMATFAQDTRDTDEDGLSNYSEIIIYGSDPNEADTSGDGISDGQLVASGVDPTVDYSGLVSLVVASVTNNPIAYNLYTESSIMDLNMGGLMLKKSTNSVDLEFTIEIRDNLSTNGWQVYEQLQRQILMGEDAQFLRVGAGPLHLP
jgi:hypothetical protein